MINRTQELLESLLNGHELDAKELDDLLADQVKEDLHLDYKHGDILKDDKKASRMVREYVCGFANAAGGVLMIGVDGKNFIVTGAKAPGGMSLKDWASRCLTPVAGYLTPPPRLAEVSHPNGLVLVVAVARAPSLVPDVQNGQVKYRLRLGDQTIGAPEYLLSDLLLGKRQQPLLRITSLQIVELAARSHSGPTTQIFDLDRMTASVERHRYMDVAFTMNLTVENQSMVHADDIQIGMLSWGPQESSLPISRHVSAFIDFLEPDSQYFSFRPVLQHGVLIPPRLVPLNLRPFAATVVPAMANEYRFSTDNLRHQGIWKATIYVLARNCLPVWYQVELVFDEPMLTRAIDHRVELPRPESLSWKLVSSGRPVVTLERWQQP